MAQKELNNFNSGRAELTTSEQVVYKAPLNYVAVILLAQATNTTSNAATVTFLTRDVSVTPSIDTELTKDFALAPNDSAGLLTGKLVIRPENELVAYSDTNSAVKLSLSMLESLDD